MTHKEALQKSLEGKLCMRFFTHHPDKDHYDGIITQLRKEFFVLQEERDFEWDGTQLFPNRALKGALDNKNYACYTEILRQNGAIESFQPVAWLDSCDTLRDVFMQLKERDIWPGVETLYDKKRKSAFYIGPLTNISDKHFSLWCYDAEGKWEKEYRLSYKSVFRIAIDDKYVKHFNAYMRKQAPPQNS